MFNQFGGQQPFYNAPAMPYLPQFQNPQPTQPQQTANVSWVYVNGIDGARNQIVQPGQTSWMMDNNDPIIYVKSVDGMGTATLKAFKLNEINTENKAAIGEAANLSAYVQKSEIDSILSRIKALEETVGGIAE